MEIIDYTKLKGDNKEALDAVAEKAKKAGIDVSDW